MSFINGCRRGFGAAGWGAAAGLRDFLLGSAIGRATVRDYLKKIL